jgi:Flp pilus assembly protein TadG
MNIRRHILRFATGQTGIAGTEFAIILPVLLIAWLGMSQLLQIMQAAAKTTMAAQTAAELQTDSYSPIAFTDLQSAISQVLAPLPSTTAVLSIDVVDIVFSASGAPQQSWRCTSGTDLDATVPLSLADNLGSAGQTVIMVTVTYQYTPTITGGIFGSLGSQTFRERSFNMPRNGQSIASSC